MSPIALAIRDNENGPRRCVNTNEGLTHSSDLSREGLGMKPTQSPAETKTCAKCRQDLPRSSFTAEPRMKSGLKSYCRDCCRLDARARYAADPERVRATQRAYAERVRTPEQTRRRHLWAMYRLTVPQYDALLEAQGGRCAICKTVEPGGRGNWHVDHCHNSNEVRGLLCNGCNVGLGHFRDDPDRLQAAIRYLKENQ